MTGALDWLYDILMYLCFWICGWKREKKAQDDRHASSQSEKNQREELGMDRKGCNDNPLGVIRLHNKNRTDVNLKLNTSQYRTTEIKSRGSSRVIRDTRDTHNPVSISDGGSVSNSHVKTTDSRVRTDTRDTHNPVDIRYGDSVSNSHVKTTDSRVRTDTRDTHNPVDIRYGGSVSNSHVKTTDSRVRTDTRDTHNPVDIRYGGSVSNSHVKTTDSRVRTDTRDTHNPVDIRYGGSVSNSHVKTTGCRVKTDTRNTHNPVSISDGGSVSNSHVKTTDSRVRTDTRDTHNPVDIRYGGSVSNSHVKTTGSQVRTDTRDTYNPVDIRYGGSVSNVETNGYRIITDTHDLYNPVNKVYDGSVSRSRACPLSLTEDGSKKEMAAHRVLPKRTEKSFDIKPDKNVTCGRSSNTFALNTYKSKLINKRLPNPVMNFNKTKYVERNAYFRGSTPSLQRNQREHEYQNKIWKPVIKTFPKNRRSYNECRRYRYEFTSVDYRHIKEIQQFYDEKVKVDNASKFEAQQHVEYILKNVLKSPRNKGRFAKWADAEGSVAVGVKVGKADESDYSVDVLVEKEHIDLSDEPFRYEFVDDIDSYYKEELSTTFVDAGKRLFLEERRTLAKTRQRDEIPNGYIAAKIGTSDSLKFKDCCIQRHKNSGDRTWFLPYYVLSAFHSFVGHAVQGLEDVTLNKGVKGPAVTLTVLQEGGPNISIDITLKLTLPTKTLSVLDFGWPRKDTRKWLAESKITAVTEANLYLVPKGDKYWKISFASCERELLLDIDMNNTWRKGCLRIMKKKFMIWKSKSKTGFKGLSSYLLKTTFLWLCEILPDDKFWYKDELANRCLNFLEELENRLRKGKIGEYFNQSVNLLENKDVECTEELRKYIEEEIALLTD